MSLENGFDPDPRVGLSSSETSSGNPSARPGTVPGSPGNPQSTGSPPMSAASGTSGPELGNAGYATPGGSGPETLQYRGDAQWRERSARDRRRSMEGRGRETSGSDLAHAAKAQASGLMDYARSSAQAALSGQQQAAAESMQDLAGALRVAGQQLERDQRQGGSRLARHAADTLEQFSGALRDRDIGSMAREVEGFARRQPAAFIGAAVCAGFLAMRFLKSGQPGGGTAQPRTSPGPLYRGTDNRNLH